MHKILILCNGIDLIKFVSPRDNDKFNCMFSEFTIFDTFYAKFFYKHDNSAGNYSFSLDVNYPQKLR